MGGPGSGGRRSGAGRKPKSVLERSLDGNAGHRPKVVAHPSVPVAPPADPPPVPVFDESDAPDDLTFPERKVWLELAPHATANGTLTPATAIAFKVLCRTVVLEDLYAGSVKDKGSANHRGVMQQLARDLLRFNLAPCGKPMVDTTPAAPAVDPIQAKYFA